MNKLNPFVIVNNNSVISPYLVTTREYGEWFESEFDKYTSQLELYIKSVKQEGKSVLEWHPGTKIGAWFNKTRVNSPRLKCWYIGKNSKAMRNLVKHNLASFNDTSLYQGNDYLKTYTAEQIQLYIRTNINKDFDVGEIMHKPIQIKVTDNDLKELKFPDIAKENKQLLF